MMQVKGAALSSIMRFVKNKFPDKFQMWLDSLSEKTQSALRDTKVAGWYDMNALKEATKKVCAFFYGGDVRGAREMGRVSAEYSLKGIFVIFVKIGSPNFVIGRAGRIIQAYYMPSEIEIIENTPVSAIVRITKFDDIDPYIEARISGWIEMALSIHGVKNEKVEITRSLANGDPYTELVFHWDN